jgi:hypothetical protein
MNISTLFEDLLQKPELYLGATSLTRLWAYVRGYMMALDQLEFQYDDDEFSGFCKWVETKYNLRTTNSWAEIILFSSFGDEYIAVKTTRELWAEYKVEVSNLEQPIL